MALTDVAPLKKAAVEGHAGKYKAEECGATDCLTTPVQKVALSDDTVLTVGAVADGQYLKRDGTALVGAAGGGGGVPTTRIITAGTGRFVESATYLP